MVADTRAARLEVEACAAETIVDSIQAASVNQTLPSHEQRLLCELTTKVEELKKQYAAALDEWCQSLAVLEHEGEELAEIARALAETDLLEFAPAFAPSRFPRHREFANVLDASAQLRAVLCIVNGRAAAASIKVPEETEQNLVEAYRQVQAKTGHDVISAKNLGDRAGYKTAYARQVLCTLARDLRSFEAVGNKGYRLIDAMRS